MYDFTGRNRPWSPGVAGYPVLKIRAGVASRHTPLNWLFNGQDYVPFPDMLPALIIWPPNYRFHQFKFGGWACIRSDF